MYQSPAVFGILLCIICLTIASITVSIIENHPIGVLWPSIVALLFGAMITGIVVRSKHASYLLLATFAALFSLIMWLVANISYTKPSDPSIEKHIPLILSVAALALYIGFLAGEQNNDNNYIENVVKDNLIAFAKKNPRKFAKIASGKS